MSHEGSTTSDSFFRNQALYGRYRWPTLIALLTGFVWALQPVAIYYALEPGEGENIQNAIATDTMVHFLIPLFLWVFFWIAFVILGHFSGARMRVGRLFKLTGWGMAPFALIGAVRALGKYYAYQGETLPIGVTIGRFPSEWRGYNELIAAVSGDQLLVAANVGSCIFLLLSGYIWLYTVRYSTNLEERRKIVIIVAVPTLLFVAYTILPTPL